MTLVLDRDASAGPALVTLSPFARACSSKTAAVMTLAVHIHRRRRTHHFTLSHLGCPNSNYLSTLHVNPQDTVTPACMATLLPHTTLYTGDSTAATPLHATHPAAVMKHEVHDDKPTGYVAAT